MNRPEDLSVKPNPAAVGGTVTIKGNPGEDVYIGYKGTITKVQLDKDGTLEYDVPGKTAGQFTVSDGKRPPQNEIVEIISSKNRK